jgi:hypothetical protein
MVNPVSSSRIPLFSIEARSLLWRYSRLDHFKSSLSGHSLFGQIDVEAASSTPATSLRKCHNIHSNKWLACERAAARRTLARSRQG